MKSLRRVFWLVLAVLLLAWAFLFAVLNDTPVPLDLVLVTLAQHHLSWWVFAAFAAGLLLGWLLSGIAAAIRTRRRRRDTAA